MHWQEFKHRMDRVISLGAGGAFLGALIAQLQGAIVIGVIISLYAWFYKSHHICKCKSMDNVDTNDLDN
jgi:hypothetical protein